MNYTLRDPNGNVLLAVESSPVVTEADMKADLDKATKACESAFDEVTKYQDAMAVMSSEGFGEQVKAVAGKVWEKIREFFAKIADWFGKLGDALNSLLVTPKFVASAGPKGKELLKLQGEISKQQSTLYTQIGKDADANMKNENSDALREVYSKLRAWASIGMSFTKEVFAVCKAYSRGISIISKLTDKSKLGVVETFADKALAIVNKVSQTNFLYEATYQKIVTNPDTVDEYYQKNGVAIHDGQGQLNQLKDGIANILNVLEEEEKKLKATPSNPAPEPAPTKPAA